MGGYTKKSRLFENGLHDEKIIPIVISTTSNMSRKVCIKSVEVSSSHQMEQQKESNDIRGHVQAGEPN